MYVAIPWFQSCEHITTWWSRKYILDGVWQQSPASSLWAQSCTPIPLWRQFISLVSLLLHTRLSRKIGPVPWPKAAPVSACAPVRYQNKGIQSTGTVFLRSDAVVTIHFVVCLVRLLFEGGIYSRETNILCKSFGFKKSAVKSKTNKRTTTKRITTGMILSGLKAAAKFWTFW